jgi:hypothetical protein
MITTLATSQNPQNETLIGYVRSKTCPTSMVQASVLGDDVYVYRHWTDIKIEAIICTSGAMHWIQDFLLRVSNVGGRHM